jgi:hypothetical protein
MPPQLYQCVAEWVQRRLIGEQLESELVSSAMGPFPYNLMFTCSLAVARSIEAERTRRMPYVLLTSQEMVHEVPGAIPDFRH